MSIKYFQTTLRLLTCIFCCVILSINVLHAQAVDYKKVSSTLNELAKKDNVNIRGYISTAFGCPYEGTMDVSKLLKISEKFFNLARDEYIKHFPLLKSRDKLIIQEEIFKKC